MNFREIDKVENNREFEMHEAPISKSHIIQYLYVMMIIFHLSRIFKRYIHLGSYIESD